MNSNLSILGQTTCPKILGDVHLWGPKHQMTIIHTKSQQPQLQMLVFHSLANHHICVVLRSSISRIGGWNCPKLMHNPNILKS